jgi:hypothetical protein
VGIFSTAWKSRKDLESQYDIDLRKRRIGAYKKLWELLEPLSKYSPPGPVTLSVLRELSADLRHWYFTAGGIFLSEKTREPYFNLQQGLEAAIACHPKKNADEVPDETLKVLKALGSRLRTSCTDDVATRVRPRLGASVAERLALHWHRRSPVSVQVDRRWRWDKDGPVPYYFVIVKNISGQVVTVTSIGIQDAEPPRFEDGKKLTNIVLRPTEPVEVNAKITAPDPDGVPRVTPTVEVMLAGRRKPITKTSRYSVPIPGNTLASKDSEKT